MSVETTQTTLSLPDDLLEAVDRAVQDGLVSSRTEFVATALRHELDALARTAVDAAYAEMANDPEYLAEAKKISQEFATADWEALRAGEEER